MTREEARIYWTERYEAARKWDDPHWEASERKEHRRYVDALNAAIKALSSAEPEKTYIGIDIPYGSDKGIATIFKGKDDKLILEEVKELMRSWIPCSERLPNEDECGWYLVTVKGHELFVDTAPFSYELWEGLYSHQKVIAWKPLPKPYREDGE